MNFRSILISLFAFVILSLQLHAEEYDVAIYTGTASGVIAAVQAKRIGKSVIIVRIWADFLLAGSSGLTRVREK